MCSRLHILKIATVVSPIQHVEHAVLQCDLATPLSRGGASFHPHRI